jgi:hypothetical protein
MSTLIKRIIIKFSNEIQNAAVAKTYNEEGLPEIQYEEMHKYFPIYEEAVSHI